MPIIAKKMGWLHSFVEIWGGALTGRSLWYIPSTLVPIWTAHMLFRAARCAFGVSDSTWTPICLPSSWDPSKRISRGGLLAGPVVLKIAVP